MDIDEVFVGITFGALAYWLWVFCLGAKWGRASVKAPPKIPYLTDFEIDDVIRKLDNE